MRCELVQRLLTEDLDYACKPTVRTHLDQCSECQELFEDLEALEGWSDLLKDAVRVPTGFSSSITGRIRRSRFWALQRRLGVVAASVAGLVVASTWIATSGWMGPVQHSQDLVQEDFDLSAIPAHEAVPGFLNLDASVQSDGASEYLEVIVDSTGEDQYILRVPSTIEVDLKKPEGARVINASH